MADCPFNCDDGWYEEYEGLAKVTKRCPCHNPEVDTPVEERTKTCPKCGGEGEETYYNGLAKMTRTCSKCGGFGKV